MATQKVWMLQYVAGNPKMFSKVTTAAGSPMKRSEALGGARTIENNGGGWRVWVQHTQSGVRIFESAAEKKHQANLTKEHTMQIEFGKDGVMKWQRVNPPIPWEAAKGIIVADRHLPDGTRQHMVRGSVPAGLVIANAQVIGEDDAPQAQFAEALSHLSQ